MLRVSRKRRKLAVSVLATALVMSGCETTSNWLKGRRTAEADDTVILGAPEANTYLTELYSLTGGEAGPRHVEV